MSRVPLVTLPTPPNANAAGWMRYGRGILVSTLAVIVHTAAAAPLADRVEWFGFAQLTAEHVEQSDHNVGLGSDRVRLGARWADGAWFGAAQLDFGNGDLSERPAGTAPRLVQDAYLGYRFSDSLDVRAGQFKTPLGMDFHLPGAALDLTKRGIDNALLLNRAAGVQLGWREARSGWGMDAGVFAFPGRSGAVRGPNNDPDGQAGRDFGYALRVLQDFGEHLHLQGGWGRAEAAGGPGARDYDVFDLAGRYAAGRLTLKAEIVAGRDLFGTADRDQQAGYAHAGWQVHPDIELVLRHYQARSDFGGVTRLGNTYIGANFYLGQRRRNGRLQLNYVVASGHEDDFTGIGGYRDDALLLQFQVLFDRL